MSWRRKKEKISILCFVCCIKEKKSIISNAIPVFLPLSSLFICFFCCSVRCMLYSISTRRCLYFGPLYFCENEWSSRQSGVSVSIPVSMRLKRIRIHLDYSVLFLWNSFSSLFSVSLIFFFFFALFSTNTNRPISTLINIFIHIPIT